MMSYRTCDIMHQRCIVLANIGLRFSSCIFTPEQDLAMQTTVLIMLLIFTRGGN